MTAKSNSIGWRRDRRRRLLHRINDTRFILLELRLHFFFDRARPLQEGWLVLVDGHAYRSRLLRAVLAVVLFRKHGELLEFPPHRHPRNAVDGHRIRALGHRFLDWRHARAGDTAQLSLREAFLHPSLLAATRVIGNGDLGLVEVVDALRARKFGI